MIKIHISAESGVPVYLQIEHQIAQAIAAGLLLAGEALPSTRSAAAELCVNPNTVARAYTDLEREGIIRTVPGGGTFVAELTAPAARLSHAEKLRRIRPLVEQVAAESAQLGVSAEILRNLLDGALERFTPTRAAGSAKPPPLDRSRNPEQSHRRKGANR